MRLFCFVRREKPSRVGPRGVARGEVAQRFATGWEIVTEDEGHPMAGMDAASLRDGAVWLNGRPLALDSGDELPPIAGAPTTANTVTFKPATITFLAIPAAGNNTCR